MSHIPKDSDLNRKEPDGLEAETLAEVEAMRKAAVKCGLTLHDYMLHCLLHKGGMPGQTPAVMAKDGTTPVNAKKRPYNKWPQLTNPRKIAAVKAWFEYSTYAKERGTGQPTFKDCFDELEDKLRTLGVTSPKHLQSIVKSRHEAKRVAIEKENAAKRQEKRMKDPLTD